MAVFGTDGLAGKHPEAFSELVGAVKLGLGPRRLQQEGEDIGESERGALRGPLW